MKAHAITVLVTDHEGYGADAYASEINNLDRCSVISSKTVEIGEWRDDHPLNINATQEAEFSRLFRESAPPKYSPASHPHVLRQTHTFATLPVSRATWREVEAYLLSVDYGHAIIKHGGENLLDMHGIALSMDPSKTDPARESVVKDREFIEDELRKLAKSVAATIKGSVMNVAASKFAAELIAALNANGFTPGGCTSGEYTRGREEIRGVSGLPLKTEVDENPTGQ